MDTSRTRRPGGSRRIASRGAGEAGGIGRWLAVLVVLAVLVTGAGLWFDAWDRFADWRRPDPLTEPAAVPPPEGVTLPEYAAPAPVADAVPASRSGDVDPAAVERALRDGLRDPDLGPSVVARVGDLSGRGPDWTGGADDKGARFLPASTTKLLTAIAALEALGPDRRFATRVVQGESPRQVVLVGGGDPYLGSRPVPPAERDETYPDRADVVTLARRTASALGPRAKVRVAYDDSLFTGPTDNPKWRADYVPDDIVTPITALWVDQGRDPTGEGRVDDPSRVAAETFARALTAAGVKVRGAPTRGTALPDATELARVESAPVARVVEHMLDISDNETAEVLAHHVGIAVSNTGSFAGGADGVLRTLRRLGIETGRDAVYDGSGLSRFNRVSADTLLAVLRRAAEPDSPHLRPVLTGLPVAGFTGSLTYRFDDGEPVGQGAVRAKTGTLTGVHALAGVVTDRDGNTMVFVLAADRVAVADSLDARQALDRLAAELAACRCSAG